MISQFIFLYFVTNTLPEMEQPKIKCTFCCVFKRSICNNFKIHYSVLGNLNPHSHLQIQTLDSNLPCFLF